MTKRYRKKKIELIATEIMGWKKSEDPWAKKYGYWDDNGTTLCNHYDPTKNGYDCEKAWMEVQKSHEAWLHCFTHTIKGWHGSKRRRSWYAKEESEKYRAEIIYEGQTLTSESESSVEAMVDCMLKFIDVKIEEK